MWASLVAGRTDQRSSRVANSERSAQSSAWMPGKRCTDTSVCSTAIGTRSAVRRRTRCSTGEAGATCRRVASRELAGSTDTASGTEPGTMPRARMS